MRNLKNVLKIVIISFILFTGINSITYATSLTPEYQKSDTILLAEAKSSFEDITKAGRGFIDKGKENSDAQKFSVNFFAFQFAGIGSVLVSIGVAVLVIVISIMGIKWITAKPDKKAQLKQQLIGVVVAAIVLFGAVGIWQLVQQIMSSIEDSL